MIMATVQEFLERGDLTRAVELARDELEQHPRDHGRRFLLFELMVVQEDFEEAMVQLNMLRELHSEFSNSAEFFLGLIEAERNRQAFMSGGEGGVGFLAEPPAWAGEFAQIPKLIAEGEGEAASKKLADAWGLVPSVSGTLNGERRFSSLRDADDVLGPFLEAVAPGAWIWLPLSQLRSVTFLPPQGYPDVIWRPTEIVLKEGQELQLWVPSNYSGTGARSDLEKLGRMTMFDEEVPALRRAYGQRDFMIDASDQGSILMGIQNVQSLTFDGD